MNPLQNKLLEIGLSHYETVIYTFLLENGSATAQKIYTKTGVNRVTTYNILEGLGKKGLVSSIDTEKKKKFIAENPRRIADFLEHKQQDIITATKTLEMNKGKLAQFLPELEIVYDSVGEKPKVRFFEGVEGIRALREDILGQGGETGSTVYNMVSEDLIQTLEEKIGVDLSHRKKVLGEQVKRNIKHIAIYTYRDKRLPDDFYSPNTELHFVSTDEYPIDCELIIYGNKVVFLSPVGNMVGILIENKEIVATLLTLFRLALKQVDSPEKKDGQVA